MGHFNNEEGREGDICELQFLNKLRMCESSFVKHKGDKCTVHNGMNYPPHQNYTFYSHQMTKEMRSGINDFCYLKLIPGSLSDSNYYFFSF